MKLKEKTALITGSGKKTGIGYAIAKKFASSGCNIIVADYGSKESLDADVKTGSMDEMEQIGQELNKDFNVDTHVVNLDVTDTKTIEAMIPTLQKKFSSVDILVNNAGATFGVPNGIHTYDETDWMKTIDINLHGVFP